MSLTAVSSAAFAERRHTLASCFYEISSQISIPQYERPQLQADLQIHASTFCMTGRAQPSYELRAKTRTAGETREYKAAAMRQRSTGAWCNCGQSASHWAH